MKKIFIGVSLLVFGLCLVGCMQVPPEPKDPTIVANLFTDYEFKSVYLDKDNKISVDTICEQEFYQEFSNLELTVREGIVDELDLLHRVYFWNEISHGYYYINFCGQDGIIVYATVYFNDKVFWIETNVDVFNEFIDYLSMKEDVISLQTETIEVEESVYEYICEEYSIVFNHLYYVIDDYFEYIKIYSSITGKDIEPLDKESGDKLFEDKVVICYARVVSGSRDFIPIEYKYYEIENKIKFNCTNIKDGVYPDVEITYCFDLVDVPKDIYEKLIQ